MSSGHGGTVPFWMGCHRVPGTEDPMKVRLETHPCEGGGSIAPCWAIVWQTGEEDVEILVAHYELEPLAEMLMNVAASYREGQREERDRVAVSLALHELEKEALLEVTDDAFFDERELSVVPGAEGWGNGDE